MITVKQAKKIDPTLKDMTDEEIEWIIAELYDFGELAFDCWFKEQSSSKFPDGSLSNLSNDRKI